MNNTRQNAIETIKLAIEECREEVRQYEVGDYERTAASEELSELVQELNELEAMSDEEYAGG